MRWDRRIRKTYLKLRTVFHTENCDCQMCIKESLIGRCSGIGITEPKPLNIFYRLFLRLRYELRRKKNDSFELG
jgi:hypothetical protein